MHYPCNYGYIPHTLSEDGGPADVLVISPVPLITGVVVRCHPLGMLRMIDEAGEDAKLLAVPINKLCNLYQNIASCKDLPQLTLFLIAHFLIIMKICKKENGSKSKDGKVQTKQNPKSSMVLNGLTRLRTSPYFSNCHNFHTGKLITIISTDIPPANLSPNNDSRKNVGVNHQKIKSGSGNS